MHLLFSKRLLSLFVLVTCGVALVSCDSIGSDDGNGGTLDPDQAKSEVASVDSDLSSNLTELTNGSFATTAQDLFGGSGTTASTGKTTETPLGIVLLDQLAEQDITPSTTGVYDWSTSEQAWIAQESSERLVLNFPASPSASSNNAAFRLSEYTETQVTLEGEQEMVPATVDASMTIEGTEVFSVNLSNTSFYSEQVEGSQVPQNFTLEVLTAPQLHTFQLDSPSKSEFEFEFDLEKDGGDGENVLGLLVGATLNSDFDNVTDVSGLDELTGSVELGPSVTLDYTIDVDGIDELGEDPSVEEVNDRFTAALKVNEQKAGDIEFARISQEGETIRAPVIVYSNGDQEQLQEAFSGTFQTIIGAPVEDVSSTAKSAANSIKDAVGQLF